MTTKAPYRTRQQRELLQYLRATPGMHHTAAEIHEHFNGGERPIGMATIYRQLERFVDEGIVRKYVLETGDGACYEYEELLRGDVHPRGDGEDKNQETYRHH